MPNSKNRDDIGIAGNIKIPPGSGERLKDSPKFGTPSTALSHFPVGSSLTPAPGLRRQRGTEPDFQG